MRFLPQQGAKFGITKEAVTIGNSSSGQFGLHHVVEQVIDCGLHNFEERRRPQSKHQYGQRKRCQDPFSRVLTSSSFATLSLAISPKTTRLYIHRV